MPERNVSLRNALVYLVLVLGTIALYWPVRSHEFVWLDDPDYVIENAFVKMGITWEGVSWAFSHSFSSNWHPLTWLSHMLDWQLFGANVGGHHLVNVAFHAANSLILLGFLNAATGAFWRSAIVAALFAWHPTHVESVAWVSERKDVLSTFFGLITLWAFVKYVRSAGCQVSGETSPGSRLTPHASRWYWFALLCFALGLMCKPMLVTWPCVMLLLDFWPLRRVPGVRCGVSGEVNLTPDTANLAPVMRRLILEKIPFFALAATSCVITVLAQDKWHALAKSDAVPFEYRVANAVVSLASYLGKLICPTNLAVFYPFPTGLPWEQALFCGVLLTVITVAVIYRAKAMRFLPVGWFWYLGTLVPVIGLVQVGGQAMADRYTYVPSIGFFVAVVWLTVAVASRRKWGIAVTAILGAVGLAICLPLSARQIATWKNTRTLFEQARRVTTGNFIALNTLGELLRREGRLDEAIIYFREAVAAGPSYPLAWSGLGMALYANGQKEEGLACQQQALKLNPDEPQALDNLGLLLIWENRAEEALTPLRHALEVRPGFAEAHAHLGHALETLGRHDEALTHYLDAVKFKPEAGPLHASLAAALAKAKRLDEAIVEYRTAIELQPQHVETRLSFAGLLMENARTAEATEEFRRAIALSPTNVFALDGLGYALAQGGQIDEAQKLFQQVIALSPTNAFAHLHLGMMLERKGSVAEAMAEYRRAVESNPRLTAALNNLAWRLATHPDAALRNGAEAIAFARRACEMSEDREPMLLGTLAAAYAEAGQFAEAIATAEKARRLAQELGLREIARRNGELLELYRTGKPYREP